MSLVNKSIIMKFLAAVSFLVGFACSVGLFSLHTPTITLQDNAEIYAEPSVTAKEVTNKFSKNEQLLVLEKVKLDKPTAVVMRQDVVIDGEASIKYRLKKGAVYKIAQANLNKANEPCIIEVDTSKHEKVELKISKGDAEPIDEGTWQHVRKKDGSAEGWLRSRTQWY